MDHIDTVIIGGGQAGLAMSRSLTARGIEHVVLERGQVGERWRSQRWDSLRLLTPRWLSRLSAVPADGDPHGFMNRLEVVRYLELFAAQSNVPVLSGVTVNCVVANGSGYRVLTDRGAWTADNVVIATGQSQQDHVPAFSADLAASLHQMAPTKYRNPDDLPYGGVLVVGASATGAQLAAEIHASGRAVTLSVGRHTRLPRRYRGLDILEWFQRMGVLDEGTADVRNLPASRNQPSMQLTGSSDHRTLDLAVLQRSGVRLVGRATAASGTILSFRDDLVETVAAADFKLAGLRLRIDRFIREQGLETQAKAAEPFRPVVVQEGPPSMDLRSRGISTVVWATGFRRSYPWLRVPVLDDSGEIQHVAGVTSAPGVYALGLNFMRTRISSFIGGVGRDAEFIAEHLNRRRATRRTAQSHKAVA